MQMQVAGGVIERDLPCFNCRYNLRGLEPGGRCPECGTPVETSLLADRWRERKLSETDPAWLKELLEGAWLALAVWFIVLALVLAPEEFRQWLGRWRSPQRAWMLGIVCVWWTLSWAAVWKLSKPEPMPDAIRRSRGGWTAVCVRMAATAYLLIPLLHVWADRGINSDRLFIVVAVTTIGCGGLTALALWVRVFRLAALAECDAMPIQALLLAISSPLALWSSFFILSGSRDSLSFVLQLPLPGFGWPYLVAEVIVETGWRRLVDIELEVWLFLLHTVLAFIALVQLLLMLMSARRRAVAHADGRTAASSGP